VPTPDVEPEEIDVVQAIEYRCEYIVGIQLLAQKEGTTLHLCLILKPSLALLRPASPESAPWKGNIPNMAKTGHEHAMDVCRLEQVQKLVKEKEADLANASNEIELLKVGKYTLVYNCQFP
jgi:hypothetical protein